MTSRIYAPFHVQMVLREGRPVDMGKVTVCSVGDGDTSWQVNTTEIVVNSVVPGLRQVILDGVAEHMPGRTPEESRRVASWVLQDLVIFLTQDKDIYGRIGSIEAVWRIEQLTPSSQVVETALAGTP